MAEAGKRVGALAIGGVAAWILYNYVVGKLRGYVDVQVYETVVQDSQKKYNPLPDASVEVDGVKGATGTDGKVSLLVPSGRRYIKVTKEGYLTACDEVEVPAMGRVSKTFYMVKEGQTPPAGEENVVVVATGDVDFGSDTWSESYTLSPETLSPYLPWWAGGWAWYLKKFTRDWVEKGTPLPDTPTPHWPFVPLTLRKYVPVKLPVGKVTAILHGTTPTGEVYTKSAVTLDSGKAYFGFVPDGEYTLEICYGDSRDLEYVMGGASGRSQRITVDKDHTVFQIHLPHPELFPKRSAKIDYAAGTGNYFIRLVEQPVPGGANVVLVHHKNPDMLSWAGGMVALDAWEADEPGVSSPNDPKVKFRYEVHNMIVGKSSWLEQLVASESWLRALVEEWVFGEEFEAYCVRCGRRIGYGDTFDFAFAGAIMHFIQEAELGGAGMKAGTAALIAAQGSWDDLFGWFSSMGMPPHLWGMVVPKGAGKYLYLIVGKEGVGGSLLSVEQGATVFIEEEKKLLTFMPRMGYHPRTGWPSGYNPLPYVEIECPECGFRTSERSVNWPLDFKQVMTAKQAVWEEFMSDAHLSKHPAGTEFEGPETRLRQVLLWGWGVPPAPEFSFSPSPSVSSILGKASREIALSPPVSVSSVLGRMTQTIGISPSPAVSSALAKTTQTIGLSPSSSVSSSLAKTTQTIGISPSSAVSSRCGKKQVLEFDSKMNAGYGTLIVKADGTEVGRASLGPSWRSFSLSVPLGIGSIRFEAADFSPPYLAGIRKYPKLDWKELGTVLEKGPYSGEDAENYYVGDYLVLSS